MNILGIIPSRFDSTRFPGKPLVNIKGKTMILRVYEQAMKSKLLSDVIVATDDERIAEEIKSITGKSVMTSSLHQSGTDRCAEVLQQSSVKYDAVINIQGDEPFINPVQIDEVCKLLQDSTTQIATLVKRIDHEDDLFNPAKPKVVLNKNHEALYFSRSVIPHLRGVAEAQWLSKHTFYKHIGIYGYQSDVLLQITKLGQTSLEQAESLEQLRWLENGFKIKCGITELESNSIDTPADLDRVLDNIL